MIEFNGEYDDKILKDSFKTVMNYHAKFLWICCGVCCVVSILMSIFSDETLMTIVAWAVTAIILFVLLLPTPEKKKNPFVNNVVNIKITQQTLTIKREGAEKVRDTTKIKKVLDYGTWWYIAEKNDFAFPIICQKDLLVEGTLEDFEKLFAGKIVKVEMK